MFGGRSAARAETEETSNADTTRSRKRNGVMPGVFKRASAMPSLEVAGEGEHAFGWDVATLRRALPGKDACVARAATGLCQILRDLVAGGGGRHPRAVIKEVGYREPKGLAAELFRDGHVDGFGRRIRIDGLGKGGRCAHFLPAFPLRRIRHVAIEARDSRDDNLVAVGFVHSVAGAAANRSNRKYQPRR